MKYLSLLLFLIAPIYAITPLVTNGTSLPFAISLPGSNSALQVAVSANGQAFATWQNGPNHNVIQGQFYNGTNWVNLQIDPNVVNAVTPTSGLFLQIAYGGPVKIGIDGSGNATLLFVNSFSQIIAMRFSGPVLANVTQLTISGTYNVSPVLAVNQAGTALAIWVQNTPSAVLARTFLAIPGGNWGPTSLFLPFPPNNNGLNTSIVGLGNNNVGTALYVDGATGTVFAESFTVP